MQEDQLAAVDFAESTHRGIDLSQRGHTGGEHGGQAGAGHGANEGQMDKIV
jgi:hypothetical protein